jgi:hypothetical protein
LRLAVCVFGLRDPEPVPPFTLAGINSRARTRWHARIAAARAAAGNANHPETSPFFYRIFITGHRVDPGLAEKLVDFVLVREIPKKAPARPALDAVCRERAVPQRQTFDAFGALR